MLEIIQHLCGRPWAIQGEIAAHVRGIVAKQGLAGLRHLAELRQAVHATDAHAAAGGRTARAASAVGVVPVIGMLTQRGDIINSAWTRSTEAVADQVDAFAADPGIEAIVLEIDSPGGSVLGVPEAFARIRAAAKKKPIVAAINSLGASAAYHLACAADEIVVTISGAVGSVGVYALHVEVSQALAEAGEKWTFVFAGKYKVEGNPAEPLGEEARSAIQSEVDAYYRMFVRDVAKGRGVSVDAVRGGFGEGRLVMAEAAVREGMADSVGTVSDAIGKASQLARERRDQKATSKARAEAEAVGELAL